MRFLSFFPFFRTRRAKTIKIRRVLPPRPTLSITFHNAAALTLFSLLTTAFVLLALAGEAEALSQFRAIANPELLAVLLSAHTCTLMFALNRNAH